MPNSYPTYQLTLSQLRDADTRQRAEHFLHFLTHSSAVLCQIDLVRQHYDEQAGTLQAVLCGPQDLIERLHYHMQTYFSEHQPTLTRLQDGS